MRPYYEDDLIALHHGDCLEVLRRIPDASIDAVVTDPPYGLEFMGKEWDGADGFRRSLNPNDAGRDNAFGRTSRTSPEYRTASKAQATRRQEGGISQASGPSFLGGLNPKCLVCDHWQRGSNPCKCEAPEWTQERLVRLHSFQEWCEAWSRESLRVLRPGGHMLAFGGTRTFHRLACAVEDAGFEIRDSIAWMYGSGFPKSLDVSKAIDKAAGHWRGKAGEVVSENDSLGAPNYERTPKGDPVTAAAAAAAAGWGTALKPAFEPVVVARKPLAGTVAANWMAHGTGALNIAACRVGDEVRVNEPMGAPENSYGGYAATATATAGRWPANVVLDESQAAELDEQAPETGGSGKASGPSLTGTSTSVARGVFSGVDDTPFYGDLGGASRFFYVAKADQSERVKVSGVAHPTVKPLTLMRWLVRLVTPPGGTVLDPFAGSGTTVEACLLEGFRCIAIEREADYLPLIVQRINRRRDPVAAVEASGEDGGLFDLLEEGA